MDWITTEQVKIEAAKGEIPALECSWEHHHQGETAHYMELINAIEDGKFHVGYSFCACCLRFKDIYCDRCVGGQGEDCPLFNKSGGEHHCCNGDWRQLRNAVNDFKVDYSKANFKAFQSAEAKVCTYIKAVLEQKKESKLAIRHGDYGYRDDSAKKARMFVEDAGEMRAATPGTDCPSLYKGYAGDKAYIVLGNIFDDLARNAEDLKSWEIRRDVQ